MLRARRKVMSGMAILLVTAVGGWSAHDGGREAAPDPGECSQRDAPATSPAKSSADTTAELRLVLNVPAYRLDVVQRGGVTRSIRVTVGQPKYATPLGHFRIDYVVWNPWWRPPPSDWARKERPKAPGWSNPVGRVKLHVTELVFLHGTPAETSLGTAASHACVRMSNADAIELARLVHAHAGPATAAGTLDDLAADPERTRTLALSQSVPVDIVYRLAEVRGATLVVYYDVYRYASRRVLSAEQQAMQALRDARGDTATVDVARLRALLRSARRATVQLPLDSLFIARDDAHPAATPR